MQPERTLVELGQKLPPDCCAENDDCNRRAGTDQIEYRRAAKGAVRGAPIQLLQPMQDRIVKHAARPAIGQVGQARNDKQGDRQRGELGVADGIGQRKEQFRLDPIEREQRQIGGDDDGRGKKDRSRHLARGVADVGLGQRLIRVRLAAAQNRLQHHDRAVDDDAKVDGAKRQEICRNFGVVHQNEGRHHRERDGDADDQRAARAAEKDNENEQNKADAFEGRARDLVDGGVDQGGTIEIRNDLNVIGLQPRIELGDLGVHAVQNAGRILAAQQQHGALDHIVHVVLADDAVALLVGEFQLAEIAYKNRRAIVLGDDDMSEVVERLNQSDTANDVAKFTTVENAAARICAVGVDRVGDILERHGEAYELLRVELKLELGSDTAEIGDVGDAGHLLQAWDHCPMLNFRKFAEVLGVGLKRVIENQTGRRGQRVEA